MHMGFRRIGIAVAIAASVAIAPVTTGVSQTPSAAPGSRTVTDPKINEPFKKPDVKAYVKKFESDDRETYAKRHEIVASLDLVPGMSVADVGAGTGLFTRLLAEKVGATGKVYAVDISREFLDHIATDARRRRLSQVVTVRGNQETTNLGRNSVDLVFLCDVYHHLEKPEKTLASIREALRSGGQLVVVEFDRVEGKSNEFVLKHVRAVRMCFEKKSSRPGSGESRRLTPSDSRRTS